MTPKKVDSDILLQDFIYETQPSKTYKLDIEKNIISSEYITGKEALKQTIYCILNTERFDYLMYSWNYGVEFKNLIGMPSSFVYPELERVIKEALIQDDRIEDVIDFEFSSEKNVVTAQFTVKSTEGFSVNVEKVVKI